MLRIQGSFYVGELFAAQLIIIFEISHPIQLSSPMGWETLFYKISFLQDTVRHIAR
jgi:hypothetical protein